MRFAAEAIAPGSKVVDFGSSHGRFGKRLPPGCEYRRVDIDPAVPAEHRSLSELPDGWADVLVSFEAIEHLTLDEATAFLAAAARVTKPGGRLFVSTPNIHHPWSFLRSATHRTPFAWDELGALAEAAGFRVEAIYRCHKDPFLVGIARFFAFPLYRVLGIDYAKSILLSARRGP
jgi:SAM-dependent methyltransferase